MIDGEVSHVLRKGAILGPDEVAPVRDDSLGVAERMYDPELVLASEATEPRSISRSGSSGRCGGAST